MRNWQTYATNAKSSGMKKNPAKVAPFNSPIPKPSVLKQQDHGFVLETMTSR